RGAGAHDGDLPARPLRGRLGDDPAHLEALVDDRALEVLDGDRRLVDAEDAGALAGRGADPARELRKVVGLVQALERVLPLVAVDQVVPLGDQVVDGAARGHAGHQGARVAERDPAVHAARALGAELPLLHVEVELLPVRDPLAGVAVHGKFALVLHEAGRFAHWMIPFVSSPSSVVRRPPSVQLPPRREASFAFISKAAISASSSVRPISRTFSSASRARLKSWGSTFTNFGRSESQRARTFQAFWLWVASAWWRTRVRTFSISSGSSRG